MKTTTKRATRRLAASLAIITALAASSAWAASRYWTGADDTIWDNTGNWEGGNSPGNDEVYFQNDKFASKFTDESGSVITFTNSFSVWRTRLRGAGTEQAPLVLRATNPDFGLDFGSNVGIIVADSSGSGYLCIESGTYPISAGIRIGENATYQGGLTVTGGAVLQAKNGNMDIQNGKVVLDNGTIEISNTGNSVTLSKLANGCELHLENGGLLTTSLISDGDKGNTSTVLFNGGTLKANGALPAIIADKANITVKVGANGGTIDASGFNIQVARPIAAEGANDGGMTFKGGGSVSLKYANTYTGMTTVEVGTTLVVPAAIAGDKLAFTVPGEIADGVYTVVSISGDSQFADDVLSAVTKPGDENATFRLSYDKKTIVCFNGFEADGDVYIGATDGDLSTASNWLSGAVPTSGAPTIFCGSAATLSVGATFAPDTVIVPTNSAVVTIGAGTLAVNTLTNACKLAVASGASLTVTGDCVVRDGNGTLLYSNEGTVTIGRAVCTTANNGKATTTKQYEVVTANTQPIRTGGFLFDRGAARLYWRLESNNTGAGAWVVGANGFRYQSDLQYSEVQWRYFAQNKPVTLHSSANWTLHNSGRNGTTKGDLNVFSNSSLTIDTSDYDDPTSAHTVTLEGRIMAEGPVTVTGCGTLEIATTGSHESLAEDYKHTYITNGVTLAVTDTATLKIAAGKKIAGEGTVSLAAGTTLALDASALGAIGDEGFTPCIPSLALPAEGTATIRIDGARLKSGDHEIAPVGTGTAANVTIDPASTALGGRKGTLRVDGGNLVLNIQPDGLMIIFR